MVDADSFLVAGAGMKRRLADALQAAGTSLASHHDILDFGCGPGRLLRHFRQEAATAMISGCDIDAPAIRWCQRNLPFVDAKVNNATPPLPFADSSFDLIVSVSIFTHLNEDHQHAWLGELSRVAKSGALLLLTVQCERLGPLNDVERKRFREKGFVYFKARSADRRVLGLPDFYQAARHSRAYIDREWSRHLEIVNQIAGPKMQQDIVVCRKRR